jgi:hypothetical protein
VALPLILAVWGFTLCHCAALEPSISDYYGLRTRDALVGVLSTVAWFLYAYRGYERKDDIAGNIACFFALGVALFPTTAPGAEHRLHLLCATALFLTLAYFSFFLFTKSGPSMTPEKRFRNRVYRGCGVIIVACIALIGLSFWSLPEATLLTLKPVFWLDRVTGIVGVRVLVVREGGNPLEGPPSASFSRGLTTD